MHPGTSWYARGPYTSPLDRLMAPLTRGQARYLAQNSWVFPAPDYARVSGRAHLEAGGCPLPIRKDEFRRRNSPPYASRIFDRPTEGNLLWARASCACSRSRAASTSRSNAARHAARRRCSTSRGSAESSTPDLDLWTTAKPFLENWMREQIGLKRLLRTLRNEGARWATMLPQLRACWHRAPAGDRVERIDAARSPPSALHPAAATRVLDYGPPAARRRTRAVVLHGR